MTRLNPLLMALIASSACVLASGQAWALYKVVGLDGKVTYTDQLPVAMPGQKAQGVSSVGNSNPPLPYALAQVVSKYPVTLYTFKACEPCKSARSFLQQRGIPYTEKSVETKQDIQALERLANTRSMPLVFIGKQQLNGFAQSDLSSYLDAAGYPATSALPKNYRWSDASPLVKLADPPSADAGNASPANTPARTPRDNSPKPNSNAPAGFRF